MNIIHLLAATVLGFESARGPLPLQPGPLPFLNAVPRTAGLDAPLDSGDLGFPDEASFEAPLPQFHGPMVDRKEMMRYSLTTNSAFAGRDSAKRGLQKISFSKNHAMITRHGRQAMAPGMAALMGVARKQADGSTVTLIDYVEGKEDGHPYKWRKVAADGTVTEYWCPIVLDLNGDGVRMSRRSARFDVSGDRKTDSLNDISAGDGLLVVDTDKDGVYGESGLEVFGNAMDVDGDGKADGYADGFEALNALAHVMGFGGDGKLSSQELAKLEKSHGLRIKVGGVNKPAITLAAAGVESITLSAAETKTVDNFDGQGNKTSRREGAVFHKKDGARAGYEDVWFEL